MHCYRQEFNGGSGQGRSVHLFLTKTHHHLSAKRLPNCLAWVSKYALPNAIQASTITFSVKWKMFLSFLKKIQKMIFGVQFLPRFLNLDRATAATLVPLLGARASTWCHTLSGIYTAKSINDLVGSMNWNNAKKQRCPEAWSIIMIMDSWCKLSLGLT